MNGVSYRGNPSLPGGPTGQITTGPDGNLWFAGGTSSNVYALVRLTTAGVGTLFPIPTQNNGGALGLTTGPDGCLWFTEQTAGKIGKACLQGTRILNVSSTNPDGVYGPGANIAITVTFSGIVTVTGSPKLALNSGGVATYSSGSGTNTLTFNYIVGAGQSTPRLDPASHMALLMNLNGATVRDASGNPALLTVPVYPVAGALANNKALFITPAIGCTLPFCVLPLKLNSGGNNGTLTTEINGAGFAPGVTVKLSQAGQPDIFANPANVGLSRTTIGVTFDLHGAALGGWDVVVTNPDGTSIRLPGGFNVVQGRPHNLWVDVLGPSAARLGTTVSFDIVIGNRGTVDARFVPVVIDFSPYVTPALGFSFTPLVLPPGSPSISSNAVPIYGQLNGRTALPLFLPLIPPGKTGVFPVTLTLPPPLCAPIDGSNCQNNPNSIAIGNSFTINLAVGEPIIGSDPIPRTTKCILSIVGALEGVAGLLGGPAAGCAAGAINGIISGLNNSFSAGSTQNVWGSAWSGGLAGAAIVSAIAGCGEGLSPGAQVFNIITSGISTYFSCAPPDWYRNPTFPIVISLDPNNKLGSLGGGDRQYISGDEPLRYVIDFENLRTATAAAQQVSISDQLDLTKVDPNTVSFGPIVFGSTQLIPSAESTEFAADVDLRPAKSLMARVNAKLDTNTGLLTWRFTSIDPSTGQPTTEPLAGFLPPNITSPQGQGSVLFTVIPKKGLATGTQIPNQATIVFDNNAPMSTPQWLNTIDNTPPSSHVLPLAATQSSTSFTVQWSGTDVGSGIAVYNIYVSENGGPFSVWLQSATATSGTFTGTAGSTYAFYSIARDLAGNLENGKSVAETSTTISVVKKAPTIAWPAPAPITYGMPLSSVQLNATATFGAASVAGTFVYSPPSGTVLSAGNGQTLSVTFTPNDTANYISATGTTTINVNKLDASITPSAASKTYGQPDPNPLTTGTLVGFLAADSITATYARTPGETVAGSPYTISATLSPAGVLANYNITYNTANFTINKAAASVTPNAASKMWGAADPPLTGTLTGFLPADNVTAAYSRTPGENPGIYSISATLSATPPTALNNYNISANTATFTIQLVTVSTIANVSGQYSDSVSLTATISPAGAPFSGMLQFQVDGTNAGPAIPVSGSGVYTATNYLIDKAAGSYKIAATLTPSTAGVMGSSGTGSLVVTKEDGTITSASGNPQTVKVDAPGGNAGSIVLTGTVKEAAEANGSPGDISKALLGVTLMPALANGTNIVCNAVANGGGSWTATCSNVPVEAYIIRWVIMGDYYQGSADTLLAVYDPSLGFVTGSGSVMDNGVPADFAFSVKYQNNGRYKAG
jgi:hypothetical protein